MFFVQKFYVFLKKHRIFVLTLRKRLKIAKIFTNNKFLRKKVGGHNHIFNAQQERLNNRTIALYERDFESNLNLKLLKLW